MKVLSLFDGMSCGQIALRELGITPEVYYASEIDRQAIAQTQLNFPATVQLGDVEGWRDWDLDWAGIDLILAGSPCQGFSFAGRMLAFDDPRSRLFFVFADILKHARSVNPGVRFLLENVNMKKEHLRVITECVGVFPVRINSALVSAQNRDRWYWTDVRTKTAGMFGELHSDIPQPGDRGIMLRDILEDEVAGKYYVPQAVIDRIERKNHSKPWINPDKAGTTFIPIDGKAPTQRCSTGRSLDHRHNYQFIKIDIDGKVKSNQEKASCFTAGGHSGGYHSDMDLIIQVARGKNPGGIHPDKAPTLSASSWERNNLVMQLNPAREFGAQPRQQNRVYHQYGKSPALAAGHAGQSPNVLHDGRISRLTPTECARLQTIPAWYKWRCSDTAIYKLLGNGWTVEVIKHILSFWDRKK